jgi:hypothetical protein
MTDQELRIKVAELVGYRRFENDRNAWWHPTSHCSRTLRQLPDYPNDLNAMHEAEAWAADTQHESWKYKYISKLRQLQGFVDEQGLYDWESAWWFMHHATARQRAEAFVAVMQGGKE